ncbi:EcsC family protein [Paracoccus sp. 1_MG-2023]|uniref:EcsC family protein n=1 Tax=unclassified Paracoccus (in: a-proteobacteria) TaxID=2688777 RepID=UPI001C08A1ED|nr:MULTISPECIES: EcsC family protein [unclassified Paracoccus (in: a-proteobacteria)]MBU2957501.1 EcsC family protein [Paracoccus sp. C2R09]MDO6670175.1 EcsC family protein [Paracoccus sp. 1_MG-2023]
MSLPATQHADLTAELDRLAHRQLDSRGLILRGVENVGRMAESAVSSVAGLSPDMLEGAMETVFRRLYDLSERGERIEMLRNSPLRANRAAAIFSGATGGWFGIAGIVPDLVASTTVIFNTIQKVARQHGFDTSDPRIRLESLAVFQFGEPGEDGDSAAQSYLAHRVLTNGQTVAVLMKRFAAAFSSRITAKFGAQTIPILGAATGAAINYAYLDYYERVANIHFRLLRLAEDHPDTDIEAAYAAALRRVGKPVRRANFLGRGTA